MRDGFVYANTTANSGTNANLSDADKDEPLQLIMA
jgi:hypothetical protein